MSEQDIPLSQTAEEEGPEEGLFQKGIDQDDIGEDEIEVLLIHAFLIQQRFSDRSEIDHAFDQKIAQDDQKIEEKQEKKRLPVYPCLSDKEDIFDLSFIYKRYQDHRQRKDQDLEKTLDPVARR